MRAVFEHGNIEKVYNFKNSENCLDKNCEILPI